MDAKMVAPNELLFDPNNPRYQGDIKGFTRTPRRLEHTPEVQEQAFRRMMLPRFKVRELAESIAKIGYLPVDRIVVVPSNEGRFLVVEGNRRLAAIRLLEAEERVPPEHANSITKIPVLILRGDTRDVVFQTWLIQGARHVGGARPWGPYQQALALEALVNEGMPRTDASEAFGLSTTAAGRLLRALTAYRAFADHPKYRSRASPEMFSFFDELVKRPGLREYYGWSQAAEKVTDVDEFEDFIQLFLPENEKDPPKLQRALDVRELARIYRSSTAMAELESPNGSLAKAITEAREEHDDQAIILRARELQRLLGARSHNLTDEERSSIVLLRAFLSDLLDGA
jgi:hypothetical protein